MDNSWKMQVAIIGAGPGGLFAADALTARGFGVALFNRDIKPGGLAEYGIFPDKYKLRNGLRNQFSLILASEKVAYFGNIHVGTGKCIEIPTLFNWGFDAVLITCGAQGIKSLGLPGEDLAGVYHAKNLVYHYNKLPPYASQDYPFGKKVAIVGAGNVMADVAHFLTKYTEASEITAVIRRGPGEVKFDRKELLTILPYLDLPAFEQEMDRVSGEVRKTGQDINTIKGKILAEIGSICPKEREAGFYFRFLSSPRQIFGNNRKRVTGLEYEENQLFQKDGEVLAKGTGKIKTCAVDNVIFAIGDRVQDELGLPMDRYGFCISKSPSFPIDGTSYEIEDTKTGRSLPGIFVAGWSRNPSSGLVGTARKDGVNAAEAISEYLKAKDASNGVDISNAQNKLTQFDCPVVTKENIRVLESIEKKEAANRGLEEFKFSTNEEMLHVMGLA